MREPLHYLNRGCSALVRQLTLLRRVFSHADQSLAIGREIAIHDVNLFVIGIGNFESTQSV
jgi:hypothetical protein